MHNGCRGFDQNIPAFLFITSPTWAFCEINERNQGYIDCGLFSMSLSLFLQYYGINTCFLNWAVNPFKDELLRKKLNIPADERGICIIAIGYAAENAKIAQSYRLNPDEFFRVIDDVSLK
jgi:nitroreductase